MTNDCTEALLSFVRETLTNESFTLHESVSLPDLQWVRGDDGVARRQAVPSHRFLTLRNDARTSPLHERTSEAVRNDPDFGPTVGLMIGDSMSAYRFDESTVIDGALNALNADEEMVEMNEQAVRDKVAVLREYVNATERTSTVLIPLPGLRCAQFPFELEDGYQIDMLTDNEINACAEVGILQPHFPNVPILAANESVGVRITITTPALKVSPGSRLTSAEGPETLATPHEFGDRSPLRLDELVEDILFVMRLARPNLVATRGVVHFRQDYSGTSRAWMTRATRQMVNTNYFIDDATADDIQELWGALRSKTTKSLPRICLRRFNAAMDRTSLEDSIIDHVIAAEALLLKDAGNPEERGELGFRLALRAGAFLEGSELQRRSTFKFMKKAYDLRSKVAHGGVLGQEVSVPERGTVPVGQFVDELGGVMRAALRKAVFEYSSQSNFATQEFWDELLLGPQEPTEGTVPPDLP